MERGRAVTGEVWLTCRTRELTSASEGAWRAWDGLRDKRRLRETAKTRMMYCRTHCKLCRVLTKCTIMFHRRGVKDGERSREGAREDKVAEWEGRA